MGLQGVSGLPPGNQPAPAFVTLALPFSHFSGGLDKHLGNPENAGKNLQNPNLLK